MRKNIDNKQKFPKQPQKEIIIEETYRIPNEYSQTQS